MYKDRNQKSYVAVIGGTNMDIGGLSQKPLFMYDSNPGSVKLSMGGVGCNIAHNLALLGVEVTLFTAIGDDLYGQRIQADCKDIGINISKVQIVRDQPSSTYLYVCDADGEMLVAVNDMSVCESITPAYIQENLTYINEAMAVVFDANIPEETIGYICEHVNRPLFADPVSSVKASKILPYLDRIHTIKPNRLEAEILSGGSMADSEKTAQVGLALIQKGVQEVYVSLGKEGVLTATKHTDEQRETFSDEKSGNESNDNDLIDVRTFPRMDAAYVQNATGAGDAFMAALIYGFIHRFDINEKVAFAQTAAVLAIESKETINPLLSVNRIRDRLKMAQKSS